MNLHELNTLPKLKLREELLRCCGSDAWVEKVLPFFPVEDLVELLEDAEEQWFKCTQAEWKEAFSHHPRIGDTDSLAKKFAATSEWAAGEQKAVSNAPRKIIEALAKGNQEYEKKFGYTFIVCATGLSAEEMLSMLEVRMQNSPEVEIEVAADEQSKITKLRIEKLLDTL
ncbi:MAG: 2-oxo-4-hydroxy-4-carboxy-5-ureidoimidazoline decarboxylase [Chitinophagaceae bacterium]|nr:2-oxo-4-hydroxy-4-carboxy-5-ureidoimidazoline decarboxylase [Chitinophagaceae bacterium]